MKTGGKIMFEKILVCLDGSKAAEQILPLITADAQRCSSQLVLLRVVSLPEVTVPINLPGVPGIPISTESTRKHVQARSEEAETYLQKIAGDLQQQNFAVDYAAVPGTPGEAIVEYAADNGITLIAIGTHGYSVARRLFIGSTADYVLRHSSIPMLMIRPGT